MKDWFEFELKKQELHGEDPVNMDPEKRADYIRSYVLATTDELHEALSETGWKPWASSRHFNRDAYLKELVDAQLFLDNLFLAALRANQTPMDLEEEVDGLVKERIQRAIKRQVDGYDGVSDKCPGCKRALDDMEFLVSDGKLFCSGCGKLLEVAA